MRRFLPLSLLMLLTLACSLSRIAAEVTGETHQSEPQNQPRQDEAPVRQEESSSRQEEYFAPSADYEETYSRGSSYFDDFSDTASGWDRQSSETLYTDYVDGAFSIAVYTDHYDSWANPGLYYAGNVQVRVEATLVGGEDDNNFGILCRYSGSPSSPNFYFFEISSDGYAVIGKTTGGIIEYLSSAKMMPSNAINQGFMTNHLAADCVDSQLTFYVNGANVASVSDSSFYEGDVGLIAGTFDAAYTEVSFDNFSVTLP